MQPDQATNNGGRTMELVAAAPRCQLLLIVLMAAMLLPGMKVAPLLIWRKIARTIELQENMGKEPEPELSLDCGNNPMFVDIKIMSISYCNIMELN
ncbi:hypothetical protein STEG23_032459 [Scotinomys teguina]